MQINNLSVGELSTNCYIIVTQKNNGIVIDPGGSFGQIKLFIETNNIHVTAIVLTHGHYDHIGAVSELKKLTNAKLYIHKDDNEMLGSAQKCLATLFDDSEFKPIKADVLLKNGDKITVDEVILTTMHTRGHTKGSCVFLCDDVMFSGDTLFKNGFGRTDLYGGNIEELRHSLCDLAHLEGDYTILSGHGEQTTLAYEKITNPYMGTNYDDIF